MVDGLYDRVRARAADHGGDAARRRSRHTIKVPADGRFSWHVNPSTRPFELKAGKTEVVDALGADRRDVTEDPPVRARRSWRSSCGGGAFENACKTLPVPSSAASRPPRGRTSIQRVRPLRGRSLFVAGRVPPRVRVRRGPRDGGTAA